jgi:hypothetical protein
MLSQRFVPAFQAGLKHFIASVFVAMIVATLVFHLWYPSPYNQVAGGLDLFTLVVLVDMVCGPLLTIVIFNPLKPKKELIRDICLVVLIQLAALMYGLYSLSAARPIWMAFEGNRFRIVSLPDIDLKSLDQAPKELRSLSLTGPRMVGVRLVEPTDPTFLESVELSMRGMHAAFRPSRWVSYESQVDEIIKGAKPLSNLIERYPAKRDEILKSTKKTGLSIDSLGYWPLDANKRNDWVVIVNLNNGMPENYLPIDGWLDN